MKREKALQIIKEVAKEIEKTKFSETMFVIGGLSTGHFDKHSDIDAIILTNKKVYAKDVQPIVKKFINKKDSIVFSTKKNEFPYRIDPKIKGIKVMLFFLLEDWVLPDLKNYKNITNNEYQKQVNYIRNKKGIILFDKKKEFTKILKKISEFPKEMKDYVLNAGLHKINYYLFLEGGAVNIERARGNNLEAQFIIGDSINHIFEIIYALNNKVMTDRKWAPIEIPNFKIKPTKIKFRLNKISELGNSKKDIDKKIILLRNITKQLNSLAKKKGIKDLPKLK